MSGVALTRDSVSGRIARSGVRAFQSKTAPRKSAEYASPTVEKTVEKKAPGAERMFFAAATTSALATAMRTPPTRRARTIASRETSHDPERISWRSVCACPASPRRSAAGPGRARPGKCQSSFGLLRRGGG